MKYNIKIGWLYSDLMSIYGDRGNIITLTKRCEWRGIGASVVNIGLQSKESDLAGVDLLFMGGAQDRQQTIVAKDLSKKKKTLKKMIEEEIPGLYICGGYQFLGKYYREADGTMIEQLGVLDVFTQTPGENNRLIGNIAIDASSLLGSNTILVGFENHGGRTILEKTVRPLGKVLVGFGSNDEAKEEGAIYKNTIGTYFHGPILPKNPELADWLIERALEKKYPSLRQDALKEIMIPLDDTISNNARAVIMRRLGIH